MFIDIPENLSELTSEQLNALATQGRQQITEFAASASFNADDAVAAETFAAELRRVDAELAARADIAARMAALGQEFSEAPAEEPAEEEPAEEEVPAEEEAPAEDAPADAPAEDAPVEAAAEEEAPAEPAAPLQLNNLGGRRPARPAPEGQKVKIRAASDVPGYGTGAEIKDFDELANAVFAKFQSFPTPMGSRPEGQADLADWRQFGIGGIDKGIPDDLMLKDYMTPEQVFEVLERATDESRLPQKSLVASGGWCAPSTVAYDLCTGETTDGIYELPEVGITRGGLKYTMGPDWSDIYTSAGFFAQTEAQAIFGTTKDSYEVPCPSWTDVRLDAVGFFLKAPVLTNAAYPELIQRWLRGYLVAHQWKKNARRLAAIQTALGSAVDVTALIGGAGSYTGQLMYTLEFLAVSERNKRRWAVNQPMEVILPEESKIDFRTDYGLRTGRPLGAVTDQMVLAEFAARNLVPTFVRGWNEIDTTSAYAPQATTPFMMFKAGTFVEGTSPVLNLSTLYDPTSLSTNIYTAAFFEEGQSVMKMCYGGVYGSIAATSIDGRTGAADITA